MSTDQDFPSDSRAPSFNVVAAKRVARDPRRPGERCRAPAGSYSPNIDRTRCEAKSDCVQVCPYGVFEVRRMDDADYRALSIIGRLKSLAHRRLTAYTPRADQCRACGLCVVACPESAVTLVRNS